VKRRWATWLQNSKEWGKSKNQEPEIPPEAKPYYGELALTVKCKKQMIGNTVRIWKFYTYLIEGKMVVLEKENEKYIKWK
jgi:hypothetical protein